MLMSLSKVYVIFNPTAGNAAESEAVKAAIHRHFPPSHWLCEIYETTGDEDVAQISRQAADDGTAIVVSAGGDGTLIGVANGLVHTETPLGILPLGTGNDLARILNIPLDLEGALTVIAGDHDILIMDALKVDEAYYLSNVSVGFSAHMMNETKSEQKKRFGRLAYIWTMLKQAKIFHLRHYHLTVDNQPQRVNAVEVMVSNSTLLDPFPQLFGSMDTIVDGQLEIYLVKARTWMDYLRLGWELMQKKPPSGKKLVHLTAQSHVHIEGVRHSELVQADGDTIGRTPVDIRLAPKVLRVIKPKPPAETTAPDATATPLVQTG